MARVDEIAAQLLGTCLSLDDVLTEDEQDDTDLLHDLDDLVEECQTCNWWCEPSEIEDGECEDCRS